MGLVSGMIMGMLFGIALMAIWHQMVRYRSSKRIGKAVDIKLLGSLNRDDLRKICGDAFPEWISFPIYEQATTMIIKETVEPLLENYRPSGITLLKFSRLSLGNVPPKIEGIRVQCLKKGQITMDIDFRWGGDPDIILDVETLIATLPIQLKDLQVFAIIRVIFQLSEEIPCISAVVVSLLSEPKPRIDYILKAVGGSLTALPGVSDMIDDTVNSIITDMLQWPHRIVVPIGSLVDTSELELKPHGMLSVEIVKATGLKNMEMIGKSDPYVTLYIRPLFKVKTKVIDDNLNPVWNESFDLIAEDRETQSIIIEVFDKDITQDKMLGVSKLDLKDLEPEKQKEMELRLMPSFDMLTEKDRKDRGILTVKLLYHQFNKEEQQTALEKEKKLYQERKGTKDEGSIECATDVLEGVASVIGSGVSTVGIGAGKVVATGTSTVGSVISDAGAGIVGNGVGAGSGLVGSGISMVGSGLSKAGKLMGKGIPSIRKVGSIASSSQENGGRS